MKWRPSRIGPRLLAFNLLVVFVPVVGVLYLDVYETRLLQAQEREMVQQARILAALLGDGPRIDPGVVERTFTRLEHRTEARLRVFDAQAKLIGDSTRTPPFPTPAAPGPYTTQPSSASPGIRQRVIYRLGAWAGKAREQLSATVRSWLVREQKSSAANTVEAGLEVRHALEGRYGAATGQTPGQRSLTLVSALPVRHGTDITGAVVVSQSTFRILQTLYHVRLRIFEIVLMSIVVAALLTTLATTTIVRPLKQLRRQASALAERRVPLRAAFPGTDRRDEIGALARSLEVLTRRLDDHIQRLESFAADVAHEFRNPLASIRTAAETIGEAESSDERQRFLEMMRRDVDRLDRLVSGVREMARIDGQLEQEPLGNVELGGLLNEVRERVRLASPHDATIAIQNSDNRIFVRGSRERLAQALENVISNAVSFAPPGTAVEVSVEALETAGRITVADRGPGIPDAHLSRVFERFFSYRPREGRRDHVGLGLAIAKQIIESYGGAIAARNREGTGAQFEISLPATNLTSSKSHS